MRDYERKALAEDFRGAAALTALALVIAAIGFAAFIAFGDRSPSRSADLGYEPRLWTSTPSAPGTMPVESSVATFASEATLSVEASGSVGTSETPLKENPRGVVIPAVNVPGVLPSWPIPTVPGLAPPTPVVPGYPVITPPQPQPVPTPTPAPTPAPAVTPPPPAPTEPAPAPTAPTSPGRGRGRGNGHKK